MAKQRKVRVLLSKSEQDAHEVNVRYLAQVLREAGVEVIFTRYRIIDEVVKSALEEDVDCIGLSFYSAGLMYDTSRTKDLLKEKKRDIPIVVGGTISEEERDELLKMGIAGVFMPGVGTIYDVVDFMKSKAAAYRG